MTHVRCDAGIEAFDACEPEEQEEVLTMHILKSESAAKAMVGNPTCARATIVPLARIPRAGGIRVNKFRPGLSRSMPVL